jgi:hypothetical protein
MWKRYSNICLFISGLALLSFGVIFNLLTEIIKTNEVVALFFIGSGLALLTNLARKKAI